MNGAIDINDELSSSSGSAILVSKNIKDDSVIGSPYLNEDWNSTIILNTRDGKNYKIPKANLNTMSGKFFFKSSNDSVYEVTIQNIDFVKFPSKGSNLLFRLLEFEKGYAYFNILTTGKRVKFYRKFNSVIRKGSVNPMSNEQLTKDKVYVRKDYYLKNEGVIVSVKLNRKGILRSIGDKYKGEVNKFVKQNKLSFKKEKDVIKIIDYYNSL